MKIKKLVVRDFIEQADLVSKKAQKNILGGYGILCNSEDMCCSHCGNHSLCSPYSSCESLSMKLYDTYGCSSGTCTGYCIDLC